MRLPRLGSPSRTTVLLFALVLLVIGVPALQHLTVKDFDGDGEITLQEVEFCASLALEENSGTSPFCNREGGPVHSRDVFRLFHQISSNAVCFGGALREGSKWLTIPLPSSMKRPVTVLYHESKRAARIAPVVRTTRDSSVVLRFPRLPAGTRFLSCEEGKHFTSEGLVVSAERTSRKRGAIRMQKRRGEGIWLRSRFRRGKIRSEIRIQSTPLTSEVLRERLQRKGSETPVGSVSFPGRERKQIVFRGAFLDSFSQLALENGLEEAKYGDIASAFILSGTERPIIPAEFSKSGDTSLAHERGESVPGWHPAALRAVPSPSPSPAPTPRPCHENLDCDECEYCSDEGDCVSDPDCEHLACDGLFCVGVPGPGQDQCTSIGFSESECGHRACEMRDDGNYWCMIEAGPGEDACQTGQDCDSGSFRTCEAGSCVEKAGTLEDSCSTDSDCSYRFCSKTGACKIAEKAGTDECSSDSDCDSYLACTDSGQCATHSGTKPDECSVDGDCLSKKCDLQFRCSLQPPGEGGASCENDGDCGHNRCLEEVFCLRVPGPGEDECSQAVDGGEPDDTCGRKACRKTSDALFSPKMCIQVRGEGPDECENHADCGSTKCDGLLCQPTLLGGNRCMTNDDCGRRECSGAYCTLVPGEGPDLCSSHNDCENHLACQGRYCELVEGEGPDECSSHADCSHLECGENSLYCTRVEGAGEDSCASEFERCPSHLECNAEGACREVPGEGVDQCHSHIDCGTHLGCVGDLCTTVQGQPGVPHSCYSDEECGAARKYCFQFTCMVLSPRNPLAGQACASNYDCLPDVLRNRSQPVRTKSLISGDLREFRRIQRKRKRIKRRKRKYRREVRKEERQSHLTLLAADGAPTIGSIDAPLEMHLFQDIGCGMCRLFYRDTLQLLKDTFVDAGKLRIVFREFPLGLRTNELELAQAARCAGRFGAYHEFLDALYRERGVTYEQASILAGVNPHLIRECVEEKHEWKGVFRDYELGRRLGVRGTPTFFLNGKQINGAQPFEKFRRIVRKKLGWKGKKRQ